MGLHETRPGAIPPKVVCTRSDVLPPEKAYESLTVVFVLGKSPPTTLVTEAKVSGGGASNAPTKDDTYLIPEGPVPFGFKAFEVEVLDDLGSNYTRAGGHPFSAGAHVEFSTHVGPAGGGMVNGSPREVRIETPRGFVGSLGAVPELCAEAGEGLVLHCPPSSIIGGIFVSSTGPKPVPVPIFALAPEFGEPAQFAFELGNLLFTLSPELRPGDNYAVDLVTQPLPKSPEVFFSDATLCSYGAIIVTGEFEGCRKADEVGANPVPFLTNPTRCEAQPPTTRILAESWEEPDVIAEKSATTPALTNCEDVKFEPSISFKPTSTQADSPTGMDVELTFPTAGLEDPNGIAQAQLEGTTVTLPEGMAVNPASAQGQGACTLEQLGMSPSGVPNDDRSPARTPPSSAPWKQTPRSSRVPSTAPSTSPSRAPTPSDRCSPSTW